MKEHRLLMMTMSAVVIGMSLGVGLRHIRISDQLQLLVAFPGEIFMQLLKLMILPLIFSSLISSLGQMESGSGKMGQIAIFYYFCTMLMASLIGVSMVLLIHPGNPEVKHRLLDDVDTSEYNISAIDSILDLIRNMFPQNIVEATMKRSQTTFVKVKKSSKNLSLDEPTTTLKKTVQLIDGTNILGVIVFCTGFGVIISKLGKKGRLIVDFFVIVDKVIMRFVSILMWFSPIGIISLISSSILDIDDLSKMLTTMALYVTTILVCLILHCLIVIPIIFLILTRQNPWHVAVGMIQPFVTAFGTASSGASLPQAIQAVEVNLGVDPRISGFIMPLGNTINMDGNALYEAVAVIFIAQLNNIPLNITDLIKICITATFASIGLNAVPAGLVSMFVILSAVGLPVADISLLFTVDWFIDRIRTALNVLGDAYCANIVQHFLKDDLQRCPIPNNPIDIEDGTIGGDDPPDASPPQPDRLKKMRPQPKSVSFADYLPTPQNQSQSFNSSKTYSLKSAIIQPLQTHVALQTRFTSSTLSSSTSEDNENQ